MTRIVRPKLKQSPVRLIRAVLTVGGIVSLALFLFSLDGFPAKRGRTIAIPKKAVALASPEQVLLQQKINQHEQFLRKQQQQQQQQGHHLSRMELDNSDSPDESGDDQKEPGISAEDDADGDESSIAELSGSRRFVMTLGGLVNSNEQQTVLLETRPDWAPIGVAHFHKLVEAGFYDQCRFFRVVPRFVVQFGIAADPAVQKEWRQTVLQDDPGLVQTNARGTVTFAMAGKNTRTTQLFINIADNRRLDEEGFTPIAVILDNGMEWIDRINDKHREKPAQGRIHQSGNEYLQSEFPDLSYIVSIRPAAGVADGAVQAIE